VSLAQAFFLGTAEILPQIVLDLICENV
jgi:hypothetical protein